MMTFAERLARLIAERDAKAERKAARERAAIERKAAKERAAAERKAARKQAAAEQAAELAASKELRRKAAAAKRKAKRERLRQKNKRRVAKGLEPIGGPPKCQCGECSEDCRRRKEHREKMRRWRERNRAADAQMHREGVEERHKRFPDLDLALPSVAPVEAYWRHLDSIAISNSPYERI